MRLKNAVFEKYMIPKEQLRILTLFVVLCSMNPLLWGQPYTDTYTNTTIGGNYSVTNNNSDYRINVDWDRSYHAKYTGGGCDCNAGNASRKTEFWEGTVGGGTKMWYDNDVTDAGQGTGDVFVGPGYNQTWYIYATAEGWNDAVINCIVDCSTTHNTSSLSGNMTVRTAPFKNPVNAKASVTEAEGSTFSSIKLSWSKGTDMPDSWTNYQIYGPDPVANNYSKLYGTVNGSTRTFTVTGLDPDKQYGFIIETNSPSSLRPSNAQSFGNVSSGGVFAFGSTLGISPTATEGIYTNKIKVNWNSFSSVVDNVRLKRSIPAAAGGGFEEVTILNKHARSYVDTDVIPGLAYTYQVIPLDVNGDALQLPEPEATGWTRPNGLIKGRVLSRGGAGVQNILITVEAVSPGLPANKAPATSGYEGPYTTLTDVDGYYEVRNIYYYDSAKFEITPSYSTHGFDPPMSFRILDANAKTQNGVNFTDTTAITVGGVVSFPSPANFGASGAGCKVEGASIIINGQDYGIKTNADGLWRYALPDEGGYGFKVAYLHHVFQQDSFYHYIDLNKTDIHFLDMQLDSIQIKVQDACGNPLATVGGSSYRPRIAVTGQGPGGSGCFTGSYEVDANGLANLVLPASNYSLQMDNATLNHQIFDGAQKAQLDAVNYSFDMTIRDTIETTEYDTVWTIIPPIVTTNLDPNGNPIIIPGSTTYVASEETIKRALDWMADFVYFGPFKIVALWEDAGAEVFTNCNTKGTPPGPNDSVIVIESGYTYPLTIEISDLYAGCLVDTGSITIWDYVADKGNTPITLPIEKGIVRYLVDGGIPNIANGGTFPFQKYLYSQISAGGRQNEAHEWWPLVQGAYNLTPTFTSRGPELPSLVVHDPPGDNSYAWIEKGSTYRYFENTSYETTGAAGFYSDLLLGSSFLSSFSEGGVAVHWKTQLNAGRNNFDKTTYETNLTFNETFSTSDDPLFTGHEGDVYIGLTSNQQFSVAKILTFDGGACAANLIDEPNLLSEKDGTFIYTEKHIKNVLIPQLEYLQDILRIQAEGLPTGSAKEDILTDADYFRRDTSNWHGVLAKVAMARDQNEDAVFVENISFSAGASYEKVVERDTSDGGSYDYTEFVDFSTSVGAKIRAKGGGWKESTAGIAANIRHSFNKDEGDDSTKSFKVGYHFSDKDIGDFFSVDILDDVTFGVPAFQIFAGTSSCPQEEGTQGRDSTRLLISPPIVNDIPIGGTGNYVASLTNVGGSQEGREYHVRVIPQTNPNGAQIRIGGQLINNGSASFFLNPFQTTDVAMTIQQGPLASNYERIGIMMYPPCEYELWENNGNLVNGDTFWISANFQTECTQVSLNTPVNGWLVNANSNNSLRFDFAGYDLNNAYFRSLTIAYKLNGQSWMDGPTIDRADIIDVIKTYIWDVSSLADGSYSVRARANCAEDNGAPKGTTYSSAFDGLIKRNSIGPFGTPTPSDGFLRLGQDISVTFDKDIDCGFTDLVPTYQPVITLTRTDNNASIPLTVQCSENEDRIILVPTIDLFNMPNLQGVPLLASVQGMQDDQGNVQEYPITWSFVVNASPVFWDPDSMGVALAAGRSHAISSRLKNTSVRGKAFTIDTYPAWLTPSTLAGTVLPDGEYEVSFLVDAKIPVGIYRDTVVAMIDGWPEYLDITYEAVAIPPNWTVDPSQYDYAMNMVLVLSKDQTNSNLSRDDNDRVAAIYNGEIRGVAQLEYVARFNKYIAFLTVYSDIPANEEISFSMWQAATGVEYQAAETFYFADQSLIGRIGLPEVLHPAGIYQVIPLTQGWNWVSLNVANSDMTIPNLLNSLASPEVGNDIVVKRKDNQTATFTQIATPLIYSNQWGGSLSQLDTKQMYMIHLSDAPDTLRIPGDPITNFDNIDVFSGWNWIGYQPQGAQAAKAALSSVNLRTRDLLIGQESFSEYHKGSRTWYGPLQFLEPGKGYKLKLKTGVLYNDLVYSRLGLKDFEVNYPRYESNMTLIGSVGDFSLDHAQLAEERVLVGAFIEDSCRGYGYLEYVAFLDDYRVIFNLQGNPSDIGKALSFKLYDTQSGKEFISEKEAEIYVTDRILGSMTEPYVLFDRLALPEAGYYLEQNYPNPYDSRTTLHFILPQDEQVRLSIYDQVGKRVAVPVDEYRAAGDHRVIFDASRLPAGVYHYRIEAGDYRASRKMVKF